MAFHSSLYKGVWPSVLTSLSNRSTLIKFNKTIRLNHRFSIIGKSSFTLVYIQILFFCCLFTWTQIVPNNTNSTLFFFPSTTGNSVSLSKENEILIQYKKLKKSSFLLRKLKEWKIKERDRGTLLEPPPELVEQNTVVASYNHGDWASTSLLLVSIQTLTHLGLKSIKFSLKHPILSKPQPLLSLWFGSKKGASVWGRDLNWWVTIYCFSLFLLMGLSWECRKRRGWGRGREQAWRWRDWWRRSRGWKSGALWRVREKLGWGEREKPWSFDERDRESEKRQKNERD